MYIYIFFFAGTVYIVISFDIIILSISRGIDFDMTSMRMHLRDIFNLDDLIADYNNGTTQHNAIQHAMRMITIHTYTYWVLLRAILVMIS